MAAPTALRGLLEGWLTRVWWRPAPGLAAWLLWPLSWPYRGLAWTHRALAAPAAPVPVPVFVVGNLVVGGAGKTPVVMALVQALKAAGHRPGVISRGHGRRVDAVQAVTTAADPREVGDEPALIHRRTGVPVFVGQRRALAATALCTAHAEVDVIVSDDGLQHHALARKAELIVFDDRGAGNGLLLPAGPLRQPLPHALPPRTWALYTGRATSTALPGPVVPRTVGRALPLAAWHAGTRVGERPLAALRGRRLTALAGIGAPEQYFALLEAEGLTIDRLVCRDHADYVQTPWPAGTNEVVTTEKDAIKLARLPAFTTPVWVLPLDCELPAVLVQNLLALLPAAQPPEKATP